jgi:transposase
LKQAHPGMKPLSICVSVSSVIKWMQRFNESRSATPKPRGGSVRRSLGCTNAIESLMAVLRQVCRNVKR